MSYGHPTTLFVTNGVNSDTLTWDNATSRWQGTVLYIIRVSTSKFMSQWVIRGATTLYSSSVQFSTQWTSNTYNSPTSSSLTWSNNWTVSEPSAGAQGDPHIKPFFGKDYTI